MLVVLTAGYRNIVHTFAFNSPQEWVLEKSTNTIRIMEWNVEYFIDMAFTNNPASSTRKEMLSLIDKYNPDVLCVLEFRNIENGKRRASVRKELDSLGYKYYYCSNDYLLQTPKRTVTGETGIFSKRPFLKNGVVPIKYEPFKESLTYVDVMLDKNPLRIYTAHLASFALYPDTSHGDYANDDIYTITYKQKRNVQSKLRDVEIVHENQVKIINDAMSNSPYPRIFCGDINTLPTSYVYRKLKNNMQDAFLQKGFGLGGTFYKILPTLRIDVAFADSTFEVAQCMVIKEKLSDHYPLIMDIHWK